MRDNLAYQEERREELIGGKTVMMAPASTNHTFTAGNIYSIFWNYLKGKQCTPIADGSTVYLTDSDHFVPDFMVVCDPSKIKNNGIHGAPDLVVEVLSPSTMRNDKTHKKQFTPDAAFGNTGSSIQPTNPWRSTARAEPILSCTTFTSCVLTGSWSRCPRRSGML